MVKSYKVMIYVLVLLLAMGLAEAIGIGMFTTEIQFEPNLNQNYRAFINNNVGSPITVELTVGGELAQYVTLSDTVLNIPAGQRMFFQYNLKLPSTIPPGKNKINIGAKDATPSGGSGFSTKTAVYKSFYIIGPHEGKYVRANLRISEVYVGSGAQFKLAVEHLGSETIDSITGSVLIRTKSVEGELLATIPITTIRDIQPSETRGTSVDWDFSDEAVGDYFGSATLTVDGKQQEVDGSHFRIGELLVSLIEYDDTFTQKGITRMQVTVKSLWNEPIEGVYVELDVGGLFLRSSEVTLDPGSEQTLSLFLDTDALALGQHAGTLSLFYDDKIITKDTVLTIVAPQAAPSGISTGTYIIVGIVILILVNVLLVLFYFRKHPKDKVPSRKK